MHIQLLCTFIQLFFLCNSWTDLIIGAPNFFDRKAEIGGAVYVYLNPFGHWDDQARPIRLNGTYDSMFGMTVSNIGDIDKDGYGGLTMLYSSSRPGPVIAPRLLYT